MVFLLVLFILVLIFINSKIKIEILNFQFMLNEKKHINRDYKIIFKFYILGKILIIKNTITKNKLDKINLKQKIKKIDFYKMIENNIDSSEIKSKEIRGIINKILKKIKLKIRKINLKIDIGTENAGLTSIIVPIISTLISIFISKKVKETKNQIYVINPIYINQNILNILLSGIFEIKMIHIINIIYILGKKEGVNKNERTSNRRTYDYSYE